MDSHLNDSEVDHLIENLSNFAYKSDYNSYSYIKNSLDQLIIPFPAISIKIGKYLFRSRRHLKNEPYFQEITDLTHIPNVFNIKEFGRANEPCQSIFYCSDQHQIAIVETSPILKQNAALDKDIISTGIWKVQKELRIAPLLNYPTMGEINPAQNFLDKKAKDLLESFRNEHTDLLLKLHTYFTNEFSLPIENNPHKYLISCAFANYVYSNLGYDTYLQKRIKLDGLIYPSAIYPSFGLNLALKPSVVEEGKIKLMGVRKSVLKRINEKQYEETETIDTDNIDLENNRINW